MSAEPGSGWMWKAAQRALPFLEREVKRQGFGAASLWIQQDGAMPKSCLPELRERGCGWFPIMPRTTDRRPPPATPSVRNWASSGGVAPVGHRAQVDACARLGVSSAESEKVRALKAENTRCASEILRQASISFARELHPHRR